MTDALTGDALHAQPVPIDLADIQTSHTDPETPEHLLSTTIAETATGVTGVHHLGGLASRALDRASRRILGTSTVPGITISQADGNTTIDLDLVVEYPHTISTVLQTVRTQVTKAAAQLVTGPVEVNVNVTDIHGPFDPTRPANEDIDPTQSLAARASATADTIKTKASDAAATTANAVATASAALTDAKDATADAITSAKDAPADAITRASEAASTAKDATADAVSRATEAASTAMDATADAVSSATDTVKASAADTVAAAADIVSDAADTVADTDAEQTEPLHPAAGTTAIDTEPTHTAPEPAEPDHQDAPVIVVVPVIVDAADTDTVAAEAAPESGTGTLDGDNAAGTPTAEHHS